MSRYVRSAQGELIDFELLAIKAQLAASPVPKKVEERKIAIDVKDGVKTQVAPDLIVDEMFAVAIAAADESSAAGKQIKKK
jgi:hypothetical protein